MKIYDQNTENSEFLVEFQGFLHFSDKISREPNFRIFLTVLNGSKDLLQANLSLINDTCRFRTFLVTCNY